MAGVLLCRFHWWCFINSESNHGMSALLLHSLSKKPRNENALNWTDWVDNDEMHKRMWFSEGNSTHTHRERDRGKKPKQVLPQSNQGSKWKTEETRELNRIQTNNASEINWLSVGLRLLQNDICNTMLTAINCNADIKCTLHMYETIQA